MKLTGGWSRHFLTNFTLLGAGGGIVFAIGHAGGSWTRLGGLSLTHKLFPRLFKRRVLHDIWYLMLKENQYHRIIRTKEREERTNLHYDFLFLSLCLAKYEKRGKGRNLFPRGWDSRYTSGTKIRWLLARDNASEDRHVIFNEPTPLHAGRRIDSDTEDPEWAIREGHIASAERHPHHWS